MVKSERVARELAVSSLNNAAIGGVLLNPLNLVRARWQLQGDIAPGTYRSLWHCFTSIAKSDGISSLWRYGVMMSCLRESSYGGMQWGLYTPFKHLFGVTSDIDGDGGSMASKVAAGLSSGIVASAFVTPVDLLMIRQFVESGKIDPVSKLFTTGLYKGKRPSYSSSPQQFASIWRSEGLAGLYRGWQPNIARAALITAGLTVSYDHFKEEVKQRDLLPEGFVLHVAASIVSGTTASVLCAPMDVVKTRIMAAPELYDGWISCFRHILEKEGAAGLFKGLHVNIARLCSAVVIQMPVMEQMRIIAGLDYFGV